jgi:negative regulator of sigma E activity
VAVFPFLLSHLFLTKPTIHTQKAPSQAESQRPFNGDKKPNHTNANAQAHSNSTKHNQPTNHQINQTNKQTHNQLNRTTNTTKQNKQTHTQTTDHELGLLGGDGLALRAHGVRL